MHLPQQLLQRQLRSLFDAETQFNVLLPCMIEKTTHASLREGLVKIQDDTMKALEQIQTICKLLDTPPTGVVCETMQNLVHGASLAAQTPRITDTELVASAREIVQYELASFDIAFVIACDLGQQEAGVLLATLTHRVARHDRLLDDIARSRDHAAIAGEATKKSRGRSLQKPRVKTR